MRPLPGRLSCLAVTLAMRVAGSIARVSRAPWASLAAPALVLGATSCVAQIREDKLYGAPRPAVESSYRVVTERHEGEPSLTATANGLRIEVAVTKEVACRDVRLTSPIVRDVETTRAFADGAQGVNAALAVLLGAGVGLVSYGEDQAKCESAACPSPVPVKTAAVLIASAAVVPLGFLIYNAARVRDSRGVEETAPEMAPGPWRPCETRPLEGEDVSVTIGDRVLGGRTGADGHVTIDATPDGGTMGEAIAIVRHEGSSDVAIALRPSAE